MTRALLLGVGAVVGLLMSGQTPSLGGHGHGGASHPVKEPPKHSGSKPAPHSPPKSPPKAPAKPQNKPKTDDLHKQGPSHPQGLSHSPKPGLDSAKVPNAIGSSSTTHSQTTKNDTTTHHDDHHGWHHDRWWHGHHHIWSEEGYWVDAATGQPVVTTDGAVAADGVDGGAPAPAAPIRGGRQVQFSVAPSECEAYDAAAQAAGMSRADWIRARLHEVVSKELK